MEMYLLKVSVLGASGATCLADIVRVQQLTAAYNAIVVRIGRLRGCNILTRELC